MDESTSNQDNTLSIAEKRKAIRSLIDRLDQYEKEDFPGAHTSNQDKLWELLIEVEGELEKEAFVLTVSPRLLIIACESNSLRESI